jgi:hypothetical protein
VFSDDEEWFKIKLNGFFNYEKMKIRDCTLILEHQQKKSKKFKYRTLAVSNSEIISLKNRPVVF